MRAFHNDPAIKAHYLARLEAHLAADEIRQNQFSYFAHNTGCAIGCTLHSPDHLHGEVRSFLIRV